MFALWGPDAATLRSAAFREGLAGLSASRVQVNIDDEPVAAALRIPADADAPIGAVVSVWTTSGPASAVVDVVAAAAERLAGWEVEERRPVVPPEVADGVRLDGLANVAMLRRPAELEPDEWRHRWQVDHTPVAIATQGTFGYLQNRVLSAVTDLPDGVRPVAALVEELFPTAALHDVHAFYGSGGDDAELTHRITRLMASVARIGADRDLDLVPTSRYGWRLGPGADRT